MNRIILFYEFYSAKRAPRKAFTLVETIIIIAIIIIIAAIIFPQAFKGIENKLNISSD